MRTFMIAAAAITFGFIAFKGITQPVANAGSDVSTMMIQIDPMEMSRHVQGLEVIEPQGI